MRPLAVLYLVDALFLCVTRSAVLWKGCSRLLRRESGRLLQGKTSHAEEET